MPPFSHRRRPWLAARLCTAQPGPFHLIYTTQGICVTNAKKTRRLREKEEKKRVKENTAWGLGVPSAAKSPSPQGLPLPLAPRGPL